MRSSIAIYEARCPGALARAVKVRAPIKNALS